MDVAWLKEGADAIRIARYRTVLELRRAGLQIEARCAGGFHDAVTLIPWPQLEAAEINPLPRVIDQVNQDLARKIARRPSALLRAESLPEPA